MSRRSCPRRPGQREGRAAPPREGGGRGGKPGAPDAPEAVAAVAGLPAGRAEGALGSGAEVAASRGEHLAGTPVVAGRVIAAPAATITTTTGVTTARSATGGLAASPAARTAARLGEAPLRVEVLLTRGEHELLPAVGASQGLVVVHGIETPLGSCAIPRVLASAVRGVRVGRGATRFSVAGLPATLSAGLYTLRAQLYRVFATGETGRWHQDNARRLGDVQPRRVDHSGGGGRRAGRTSKRTVPMIR